MKNTHKLAGAALLAAVGVGLAIPNATKAAPTDVEGKGKIVFTQDTSNIPNPTNVEPGSSTGEINEPSQNTSDMGPLKIVSVTDLDFKTHDVLTTGQDKTYPAGSFKTTAKDGGAAVETAHFVRFQDVRADGENFYKITAQMTSNFSNGTQTLKGATLKYTGATLTTGTHAAFKPTATTNNGGAFELANDGVTAANKVDVFDSKETGKGFGVYEIMFGTKAEAAAQGDKYDAISLKIPGTELVKVGQYNAVVTWAIESTR